MFNFKLSDTAKRYIISSLITFFSAALMSFLSGLILALDTGVNLTMTLLFSLGAGAITAGLRALVKYLYELLAELPTDDRMMGLKKRTSWMRVLLSPSRYWEAIKYAFKKKLPDVYLGAADRPDPRDVATKLPLGAINARMPRKISQKDKAKKLGWTPTKQSRNACTSYSKGHGVEIVNTIEHGKPITINKEKLWLQQELTGASRDSGDYIQNAEKQFHKNPQGFPQSEYRRLRRGENTVRGAKLWLTRGETIRTGIYWKWSSEHRMTNSRYMQETGFFTAGSGKPYGGHACDMVGFDDDKLCPDGSYGAFEMLESELENWGDDEPGTFWVSYADFSSLFSKYISRDTWDK